MASKRNRRRHSPRNLPQRSLHPDSLHPDSRQSKAEPEVEFLESDEASSLLRRLILPAIVFLAAIFFAYWPTLAWAEDAWRNEPDYSHGYLVPILAGLLCWYRRDSFPRIRKSVGWGGLSLIVLAIAMRAASQIVYADFLDGWSLIPLLMGVVWLLLGQEVLRWSLPAIVFLVLMIPMPYQAETLLSWNLQGVATDLSTIFLRIVGQPAVSEGHVIWIGDEKLMVEEACSGLRIFIGVAALAFFWAALAKRTWVDKVVLLAAVVPLAVFVNAMRITVVGILYQTFPDPQYGQPIHDWSGYLMIPVAFALLWLIKVYWEHLYRPLEQMTARDFVQATTAKPNLEN